MINSYITAASQACEEIVISKSRFLGYVSPCREESDALSFLQKIREEHKTATHHCYAYVIGENSGIMRYSDDGEPGGTAGLPIMDVLRNRNVVNCCIVVVRYFGGILLGTGGLVRAYTLTAQTALDAAGIASMELTADEYCEVPYAVWDRFRYAADHLPVRLEQIEYGSYISFHLHYRVRDRETVMPRLTDAADRKLKAVSQDDTFTAWKIDL